MNFLKVVISMIALVAAIEECQDCGTDEVELLQQKTEEKQMPDWSKILGAAKTAVDSGMSKVTTQMNGAIVNLNTKILDAEKKFNASMATFEKAHDATATVSQNLTKFKTLVQQTIGSYVPFYGDAVKQVTTAVATTKTVVSAMGQQELAAKLEAMNKTAMEKLSTLMETSEALTTDVIKAKTTEYGKTLVMVNDKLGKIEETTNSFRSTFNENLQSFTAVLEAPLKVALGDAATAQITDITAKAQTMLANLGQFTVVLKRGLVSAADDVDINLKGTGQRKPFFKRVFGGMFR